MIEGREARGREAHAYPRNTCATPSATSAKVSRPRNVHAGLSATARENRCQLPVFRTGRNGNGEAAKAAAQRLRGLRCSASFDQPSQLRGPECCPAREQLEPHLAVAVRLTASGRCDMLRITTVMRNSKAAVPLPRCRGLMATIRDVAQRAGVSTMTVSRVLNNSGYVSADARSRGRRGNRRAGLRLRTRSASALRFKRTQTLALVVTDITNPFFTSISRGVEDVASRPRLQHDPLQHRRIGGEAGRLPDDGGAEAGGRHPAGAGPQRSAPVQWLQQRNVPVVVHRPPGAGCACRLRARAVGGGRSRPGGAAVRSWATAHVAMLTGPAYVSTARERVAGYSCGPTQERSITPCPERIDDGHSPVSSGYG